MIDRLAPQKCILCASCVNACPTSAISFGLDYLDFSYPLIDSKKCISCNLCEQVCPLLSPRTENSTPFTQKAYAGRSKSLSVRKSSSSGGIFWSLAEYVLNNNGYVCGAVFDENFSVKHVVTNDRIIAQKMMGSKYAQSDTSGVFIEIKKLLLSGLFVLFTGCPCQVAGLHSFLGKEYDNLLTVDLICHGIPSSKMLLAYLDCHKKIRQTDILSLNFRDKHSGWHNSCVEINFSNHTFYSKPMVFDAFMAGYFKNIFLKESCYSCSFKNFSSESDITIGDFWGAEVVCKECDDNTGLSAIIVNSPHGEQILNSLNLELWPRSLDTIIKYNRNLISPSPRSDQRNFFYEYAAKSGLSYAIKDLLWESPFAVFKRKLRYFVRIVWYRIRKKGSPLY